MSASSSTNDLKNRIIFTILILAVYRFGTFVPLPGIDPEQLKILMEGNQKGLLGKFLARLAFDVRLSRYHYSTIGTYDYLCGHGVQPIRTCRHLVAY